MPLFSSLPEYDVFPIDRQNDVLLRQSHCSYNKFDDFDL